MEQDIRRPGWDTKALLRWILYTIVWVASVAVGCLSGYHVVLQIGAGVMGLLLAVTLMMLFMTLFEVTLGSREAGLGGTWSPLTLVAYSGVITIGIGIGALVLGAPFLSASFDTVRVATPEELRNRYSGAETKDLPITVCIDSSFVKTDWEGGKLFCERGGFEGIAVLCRPEFMAAPIFNTKVDADYHESGAIQAWALAKGIHAEANYRVNGELCGFMSHYTTLDFYRNDYKSAVKRVVRKHNLHLTPAELDEFPAPLDERPLILVQDPLEVTHLNQVFLGFAVILLFFCPCVGPIPVGGILLFFCMRRTTDMETSIGRDAEWADEDAAKYQRVRTGDGRAAVAAGGYNGGGGGRYGVGGNSSGGAYGGSYDGSGAYAGGYGGGGNYGGAGGYGGGGRGYGVE